MNAASAAMKGFHQGEKEVYDREREKWEDNMKKALRQNKLEIEEYNAAREQHGDDMAALQGKMEAIAAKNKDWMTLSALQSSGGAAAAFEALKMREDAGNKLMDQFEKHEKNVGANASPIDDKTLEFMANQYIETGDGSVFTNLGRSKGGDGIRRREV